MTVEELDESLTRAEAWFSEIEGLAPEAIEAFITDGFLSFRDLTFFDPADLAEVAGITVDEAEQVIDYAESRADEVEAEEEARQEAEREAAKNAPKTPVLVEEKAPESSAKQAFESLFAPSPTAENAPAAEAPDADTPVEAQASEEKVVDDAAGEAPQKGSEPPSENSSPDGA
jgi:hypothetical protein